MKERVLLFAFPKYIPSPMKSKSTGSEKEIWSSSNNLACIFSVSAIAHASFSVIMDNYDLLFCIDLRINDEKSFGFLPNIHVKTFGLPTNPCSL